MAKFLELKTELRFVLTYLDTLKLLENEHSMKATKEAIEHALNLLKIINDRIEIAESKTINAPLPEARKWKEVKLEYNALEHLERLYNAKEEQPDKCRFFKEAECLYPIDDCINCPNNINDFFEWGGDDEIEIED